MTEVDWALLCDYAFLDSAGKMCLIGIFDQVYAKAVPAIHPQAALVIQLRGKAREAVALRIEIVRPNGGQLGRFDATGEMGESGAAAFQMSLAPLQVPDWGVYDCNIFVGGELSYTAKFRVQKPPASGTH